MKSFKNSSIMSRCYQMDSDEQVQFEWTKTRTSAKVKRECAEAVGPRNNNGSGVSNGSDQLGEHPWESILGRASKLWSDHNKYYRRQQHRLQQQ